MVEPAHEYIERVLDGDTEAYRHIVEAYSKLVAHVVGGLVRNRSDEEEIAQDVFVKAYQHLKSFRKESKFSTWIARIAHNTAMNFVTKKKAQLYDDLPSDHESDDHFLDRYVNEDGQTTDQGVLSQERTKLMDRAIHKLPSPYRNILTLYHVDEMSYHEISTIMKMPEGTVKNYLFRARRKLKDLLINRLNQEAACL